MRTICVIALVCCNSAAFADFGSLKSFTESNTAHAKLCLQYSALFSEAHEQLKSGGTLEATKSRMIQKYSARMPNANQQGDIARIMTGVALAASGFVGLTNDNARFAYLEMCRQQALGLWPKDRASQVDALRSRLATAERCERTLPPGLAQKNCVVIAFESAKAGK